MKGEKEVKTASNFYLIQDHSEKTLKVSPITLVCIHCDPLSDEPGVLPSIQ